MNAKVLIDAMVRQMTILIAQLSTAAGIRAPLAHIADQVFVDLARELESQGLGRKVVADMFGMALRGYQKKVQRLEESNVARDQTLWEALLGYIRESDGAHRRDIAARFRNDDEEAVAAVLKDLTSSGLVFVTGHGPNTAYRPTSEHDLQTLLDRESMESMCSIAWVTVYHHPGIDSKSLAAQLNVAEETAQDIVKRLASEGRLEAEGEALTSGLRARSLVVPVGAAVGWEGAVLDHFQAVATAIASKVRRRELQSQRGDVVGGATLHFDISPGHPCEEDVYGLLKTIRAQVNDLWERVCAHNHTHPIADAQMVRTCFYFGQNVIEAESVTSEGDRR